MHRDDSLVFRCFEICSPVHVSVFSLFSSTKYACVSVPLFSPSLVPAVFFFVFCSGAWFQVFSLRVLRLPRLQPVFSWIFSPDIATPLALGLQELQLLSDLAVLVMLRASRLSEKWFLTFDRVPGLSLFGFGGHFSGKHTVFLRF